MARRFNRRQKLALYWLSGGVCERCGADLTDNWHADHIKPYSWGGQTDVANGQALCQKCNLIKGSKRMLLRWPETYVLREWQEQFLTKYNADNLQDFLLVATPGSGKTIGSLRVAHELLNSGAVTQLAIVCPTDHLRTQWLEDATRVHIHLDKLQLGQWSRKISQTTDYIGLVTTYAQVASKKEELRAWTAHKPTLVILDEIHHCGDEETLTWGAVNQTRLRASKTSRASFGHAISQ